MELHKLGFLAAPVDAPFNPHRTRKSVFALDLSDTAGQATLLSMIQALPIRYIHFALPCGTFSRARDKPLPKHITDRGVKSPPPLRDAAHLSGLPHLAPKDSSRVRSANELCGFVVSVLYAIFPAGQPVVISIENPLNSWLWPYLDSLVKAMGDDAFMQWCVIFDHCMLGGTRDKAARWRGTPGVFSHMQMLQGSPTRFLGLGPTPRRTNLGNQAGGRIPHSPLSHRGSMPTTPLEVATSGFHS